MIVGWENATIEGPNFGGGLDKEASMAAILPPLVMILLVAVIGYLAWRSANKYK